MLYSQIDKHDTNIANTVPKTKLDATLLPIATDGAGHALNGAGIPSTGWEAQSGTINGKVKVDFQVATNVHYRTGDLVQPSSVDNNGVLHFNMPAGAQVVDPAHNVSSANPNRAATAFDWSFTLSQSLQSFLANGGEMHERIDLDPTAGTKFLDLKAVYDPAHAAGTSGIIWVTADDTFLAKGTVIINDDKGNANVTQNSQNLGFYTALIDTDPNTPGIQPGTTISPAGTYDIETVLVGSNGQVQADVHSVLHLA